MDSSSDNLPTSQFEQLLNSQKVNTVTNTDYIKPDVKKSSSASMSDKDFLNDFLKINEDKKNDNDFNDLFNDIKNDIPNELKDEKQEKQEKQEDRPLNGIMKPKNIK